MLSRLPPAAKVYENPSAAELKELAAEMPTAKWTRYGNLNVQTEVLARCTPSTFVVSDDPNLDVPRKISIEEAAEWAQRQDAYIADREMIVLDGDLGAQPELRVPVRLYIEASNANI